LNDLASVQALKSLGGSRNQLRGHRTHHGKWEPGRRGPFLTNFGRIRPYRTGRVNDGLAVARRLLDFRITRYGELNSDTALARGHYAVGLALAKRDDEARKEFETAVPILTATTFNTDNDDVLKAAARTRYTQVVVENYIDLLGRLGASADADVANNTFRLAGSIRSRSVQKALTAAGARMTTSDPTLAAALRQEQDLRQQIGTQQPAQRVTGAVAGRTRRRGVAAMRKQIDNMRADHLKVRADIDRRFPDYSDLIDPKPPTAAQIKEILKPSETLLSFYFGHDASFVWAISQDGKAQFVALREPAVAIEGKIQRLREALEPRPR
jgi:hypothetical protein